MKFKGENFKETVSKGLTLVDFNAVWCGPCQMLKPQLEEFEKANEDIKVLEIDTDEYNELAKEHEVMSIPFLVLYKDGEIVSKELGFKTKDMLEEWVNEFKED